MCATRLAPSSAVAIIPGCRPIRTNVMPERRVGRRDAHVAHQREAHAGADRRSVDRRDRRDVEVEQREEVRVEGRHLVPQERDVAFAGVQEVEVAAGAERRPGAGDDHGADVVRTPSIRRTAAGNASVISSDIALRLSGWFSVSVAMWPSTSTRTGGCRSSCARSSRRRLSTMDRAMRELIAGEGGSVLVAGAPSQHDAVALACEGLGAATRTPSGLPVYPTRCAARRPRRRRRAVWSRVSPRPRSSSARGPRGAGSPSSTGQWSAGARRRCARRRRQRAVDRVRARRR